MRRVRQARVSGRIRLVQCIAVVAVMHGCGEPPPSEPELPTPSLDGVPTQIADAVRASQAAVRNHVTSADAWGKLGDRYRHHDWLKEALVCYRRAASLDPSQPRWPYRLGLGLSEPAAAARELAQAVRLQHETYAPAHERYAAKLIELGRLEDAARQFAIASRLDPSSSHSELGLGQLALRARRFDQARKHLETALQRDPRHGEVHVALAQVYLALGDEDLALRHSRTSTSLPKITKRNDPLSKLCLSRAANPRLGWCSPR